MTKPSLPSSSASGEWKLTTIFLGLLVLFAVCGVLKLLQGVIVPFFIAVFLVYVFEPLQRLLVRWKLPMWLRVCLVLGLTALVIYLLGLLTYSNASAVSEKAPQYAQRIFGLIDEVSAMLALPSDQVKQFMQTFRWTEYIKSANLTGLLSEGLGTFVGFLSNAVMVLLYMIFLLYERETFFARVHLAFPKARAQRIENIIRHINQDIVHYLYLKTLISLGTGLLFVVVLAVLGVDYALFWGIVAFVLHFIPTVGTIIATVPPIAVALLQFDTITVALLVLVILVMMQLIIGNFIEPKVMGDKLGLSPLVLILALIFWGWMWGPVGMILSVPIMSAVRIVCQNVESLRPISIFLADSA